MENDVILEIRATKQLPIYIWNANHELITPSGNAVSSYPSIEYQTSKGMIKPFYKSIYKLR